MLLSAVVRVWPRGTVLSGMRVFSSRITVKEALEAKTTKDAVSVLVSPIYRSCVRILLRNVSVYYRGG